MQTVRLAASGIVYAMVSLLLVIGSLALAVAQGGTASPAPAAPTALPSSTNMPPPLRQSTGVESASAAPSPTTWPTQIASTSTYFYPATAAVVRPTAASARVCGPYAGWLRAYVVMPGDTLFRIASMHGTSVDDLQRANCKSGTVIYAGERLWVPFVLAPVTQVTIIPTFDTPTEPATSTPAVTATGSQDP